MPAVVAALMSVFASARTATIHAAQVLSSAESYPSSARYITALNSLLCRFTAARAAS
jgi:hypothetical protein